MQNRIVSAKVFPGAKKEKVIVIEKDSLEIYIREPAQRNLANMRTRECVAKYVGVPVQKVIMQTGHRTRKKSFIIKE